TPADATRLEKQTLDPVRVMQNVYEHAYIKRGRRMRNRHTVERPAGDSARWPRGKFNSLDCYGGIAIHDETANCAVAAPDVQHGSPRWNLGRERLREYADTSLEYGISVHS